MHELSLMQGVLEILQDTAHSQGFERVRVVRLEIGRLSAVDPAALRFCFDVVSDGTLAHGAALEILEMPGQGWCRRCCCEVELATRFDPCPSCGGYALQVTGGDAMRVLDLEVE
jgi:hydrogenase nickel incorporation protein HypA/HybF